MILLFGARGQMGRELVAAAADAAVEIAGTGREEVDITDSDAVGSAIDRLQPELIINVAAYSEVDRAEREPELAWRVNAIGPKVVAEAANWTGIPLIQLSTDYVFDGTKSDPYGEDDAVAPISVYGKSKAAGEAAVREATPRHLILRTAWLHGRHGNNFAKTVVRLAAERPELEIVADQLGSPTSTADLARAILSAAPRLLEADATFGTFHLAGEGVTSWFGFAERIVDVQAGITGHRPKVTPIASADYPTAARRPRNSALDSHRFSEAFGVRLGAWQDSVVSTVSAILSAEAVA